MNLSRDREKRDVYMCSKLCNMIARGDLRNDHPQQRRSGQWVNETRDNFIVSVLLNEYFDSIKICEQLKENAVVLWLIDGLQRLTYIEGYKSGKFHLGKNIDPAIIEYQEAEKDENGNILRNDEGDIIYKTVYFDLRRKGYKDLPDKLKEDFDNCPIDVVKHLDCTDEQVSRHIVRYNSGKPMVAAQKSITYMYNTAKYVKELSSHSFFSDCANYPESADRNGTIDRIISESIMGINFMDNWTKNVRKFGTFINENATKEMFDKMREYLDRLYDIVVPETGKLFSQKNAFIWFMFFDKFNEYDLKDDIFKTFLERFEELKNVKIVPISNFNVEIEECELDMVSFAELDKNKSTKDRGVIDGKLLILKELLFYLADQLNIEIKRKEVILEKTKNKADLISEGNTSLNDDFKSMLDFVRENVSESITEEDISIYMDDLEILTLEVDNSSKLLDKENKNSLISIIAFSYLNDFIIDAWFKTFFKSNKEYLLDQKENYLYMKNQLLNFTKKGAA